MCHRVQIPVLHRPEFKFCGTQQSFTRKKDWTALLLLCGGIALEKIPLAPLYTYKLFLCVVLKPWGDIYITPIHFSKALKKGVKKNMSKSNEAITKVREHYLYSWRKFGLQPMMVTTTPSKNSCKLRSAWVEFRSISWQSRVMPFTIIFLMIFSLTIFLQTWKSHVSSTFLMR